MSQEHRAVKGKTNGLRYQITHLVQQYYSPSSSSNQAAAPSIYSVPDSLRELKPKAYTPRVVSIGLLHSEDECFKHMNKLKESYMSSLFHRTAKPEETRKKDVNKTIHQCVNAMEDEECRLRVRTCYPPSAEFDEKSIARTMLVDGCFVLELLTRWWIMDHDEDKRAIDDDPIFGNNLVSYDVRLDLLLLENQIPYFILQQLFKLTVEQIQNRPNSLSLTDLILEYFGDMMNPELELKIKDGTNADHILGLLHSCYQPGELDPGDCAIMKYSATDLHRSGVKFKPSKRDDYIYQRVDFQTPCLFSWLPNITINCHPRTIFKTICSSGSARELPVSVSEVSHTETQDSVSKANPAKKPKCCLLSCLCHLCCSPTLEIPLLIIGDYTETFFRNLIAFEQLSQNTSRHITSYAFLMDTIINSKEDVELLERAEVLQNYLGTSEDASDLFNSLCKEVILGEFYFSRQWKQVHDYCKSYWPRNLALLRRTYFSSPWTGISVIAALILFAFTLIQTIGSLISLM